MAAAAAEHKVVLSVVSVWPGQVPAGAKFPLQVHASCSAGCDVSGALVTVASEMGVVAASEIASFKDGAGETPDFTATAPLTIGSFSWTISLHHEDTESSLTVTITTIPHAVSLAVWAVSSPVMTGGKVSLKAGAKCAQGCNLAGRMLEVHDGAAIVATAKLGAEPWTGTTALHWADVDVTAPQIDGVMQWSARFAESPSAPPHDAGSCSFSFAVVKKPEHVVTVTVTDGTSQIPVMDAQVRMGPYRGITNAMGRAELHVAKGDYSVSAGKAGFTVSTSPVNVGGDTEVDLTATKVPEPDPDGAWKM